MLPHLDLPLSLPEQPLNHPLRRPSDPRGRPLMHQWSVPAISLLTDPHTYLNQLTAPVYRHPSSLHTNHQVNRLANPLSSPHLVRRANHPCVRQCLLVSQVVDPATPISPLRSQQHANQACLSIRPSSPPSRHQNGRLLTQATDLPLLRSVVPLQRRLDPRPSLQSAPLLNRRPNHPVNPTCRTQ